MAKKKAGKKSETPKSPSKSKVVDASTPKPVKSTKKPVNSAKKAPASSKKQGKQQQQKKENVKSDESSNKKRKLDDELAKSIKQAAVVRDIRKRRKVEEEAIPVSSIQRDSLSASSSTLTNSLPKSLAPTLSIEIKRKAVVKALKPILEKRKRGAELLDEKVNVPKKAAVKPVVASKLTTTSKTVTKKPSPSISISVPRVLGSKQTSAYSTKQQKPTPAAASQPTVTKPKVQQIPSMLLPSRSIPKVAALQVAPFKPVLKSQKTTPKAFTLSTASRAAAVPKKATK
jgi:hypothetical protein